MPLTLPNLLSLFRIAMGPILLWTAWAGERELFYWIFGAMLLSDALDGFVARALKQTSPLGAKLDSYGDIATYLVLPPAIYYLQPDLFARERDYIFAAILLYLLPALFSFVKFRRLASYHTLITKLSAVMMSAGIVLLLLFEQAWLFHIAVWILALEAAENIAITLLLRKQRVDVGSIWRILNERE